MTRSLVVLGASLALCASLSVHAGDCFNDDGAVLDDLEPAVLKITDADIEALKAAIRAHETRALADAAESTARSPEAGS